MTRKEERELAFTLVFEKIFNDELSIEDKEARYRRLIEINTLEQCRNVMKLAEVQRSYYNEGFPKVAAWVFDIKDARLHDLNFDFVGELEQIKEVYDITGE